MGHTASVTDDVPVDHRGRSRPLYQRRSKVPQPMRVARWARLAYGLFPGLRLIAMEDPRAGAPMAGLGLLTLSLAVFLTTRWDVVQEMLRRIGADPALQLVHAGLIGLMILSFECLRLGSAFLDRARADIAPRAMAALWIPSLAALLSAPATGPLAPALVEPALAAAAVLWVGVTPPALYCIVDVLLPPSATRRQVERYGPPAVAAAVLLGLGYLLLAPHPEWSAALEGYGFTVLPRWLG